MKGNKGEKPWEGSEAGGEVQSIRFTSIRRWVCAFWSWIEELYAARCGTAMGLKTSAEAYERVMC